MNSGSVRNQSSGNKCYCEISSYLSPLTLFIIYYISASLHSGLVGCVSRRSWEDTDTHQAGCKNLLSDFRIGKVCGYHKKPGILSLFWPTVDWGVLSFYVPVSTVLKACLSVCGMHRQLAFRRHGLNEHHSILCSKACQTKPGRSLQGELQPGPSFLLWSCTCICVALPRAQTQHLAVKTREDWGELVKQSW